MDNIPTFKIANKFFSGSQIVDKSLYARRDITRTDWQNGTKTETKLKKGDYVGKVYSWVTISGVLYFMLYTSSNSNYNFVPYSDYNFSLSAIEAQGGLTVEEEAKAKEEETKSTFQKILDELGLTSLSNTLKWALPTFLIGYAGVKLYGEYNKVKKHE